MRIALTIPSAGAGKWAWTGWSNGFKELGHEVIDLDDAKLPDLLICTTSSPQEERFLKWKKWNPHMKIALNVLAWTNDDWPGINNEGVQAHKGNIEYARSLKPDIVFAQYSPKFRESLLRNWHEKEGYKLGSMEMAADSTVYHLQNDFINEVARIVYVGGYWAYKAQNIDKFLLPLLKKYRNQTYLIGRGWPIISDPDIGEKRLYDYYKWSTLCPNAHEPHSTNGGFDVVERVFKTMYCGGLCLSDYVREIEDGFGLLDEQHLLLAQTPEEYMDIAEDVLQNPDKYAIIRKQGQQEVIEKHTYINRCKQLLKDLGY